VTEPLVLAGPEGSITVTSAALTRVVSRAVAGVEGATLRRPRRTVEVAHEDGRTTVSLELAATHGSSLPHVARLVQERVAAAVASASGLEVERVDVELGEVV
jgi:uncharacterized alkaline shock family protein YloU